MSRYMLKTGVAVVFAESGSFILTEMGQLKIASPLASELLALILRGAGDEDSMIAALRNRYPLEKLYYALIQLQKGGVIVDDQIRPESPADLFRDKVCERQGGPCQDSRIPALNVRVVAVGEVDIFAHSLVASLSRSDLLATDSLVGWHGQEMTADTVYVVATSDYLEPELEAFGRLAHKLRLRWLPVKPCGMVPCIGPLFVPYETGCVECLLDRIRGHRRLEAEEIRRSGGDKSLRLSAGHTVHSFETVAGLLAIELEKLASGSVPALADAVFTLDFRTLEWGRHPFVKRPQCPLCGDLRKRGADVDTVLPKEPLRLQSRIKADYHDSGERICSAVETLAAYARLVSPVTGTVGQLTSVEKIPACFGNVIKSDWIVRDGMPITGNEYNARASAVGSSTGRGRSEVQARASALGEAIERYCSQYEGYEPHVRASFTELGDIAIHPYRLMGFSERQYRDRETWRKRGGTAHVPDPYDATRPIDWTPAWSLTEERWKLIPSAFVFYSYPNEGGGDICRGCSNGVAAGNCLEEAIVQGFFELVERDATAMWWYHRLSRPAIDRQSFCSPFVAAAAACIDDMGMKLEVLDLTNDLGIPVFAANLFTCEENYRFKSIGLGCHRDPLIALERAVSELGQAWRMAETNEYSLSFQKSSDSREPYLRADTCQSPKTFSDFPSEQRGDFLDDINYAMKLLEMRGIEMLVVDLTRPDVRFPVARVIAPGLVHFWPRFGCRRLFEVPRAAGWIEGDADEDNLNPIPFYL